MSLQVWLPLTDSPVNMIPGLASFSKEGSITVTADSDGWYKVQDSSHTSSRWGAYYDFKVKSNTTYTLKVYSKSTTGITADIGIQSFSGSPGWSVQRDTNNTSTEKYTEYTWVTGATDYNARIYLAMRPSTTVANNYVFYKQPEVWETPKVKNQGVNPVEITNNGATYSASGKIGKCYSVSSGKGLTLPASTMTSFTDECSIAFWIKINSWKTSYDTFFQAGLNSTPWAHYRFGILRNNTNSTLCFTITNSSGNSSSASYTTSSLNTGVWYHLVFTYTTGKVRCYRNGVLDKEYTTTIVPDFAGITNISIGRGTNGSSYPTDCNLNDFRIYDHCLSPMEVKELAKGLILHYPLNRQGFGLENLATCPTPQYNLAAGTGNYNYFWVCGNGTLTVGETYTFSAEVEVSGGIDRCTVYNYQSSPSSHGGPINNVFPADGKRHSWTFVADSTGFIVYSGVAGAAANKTATLMNIKIEKGSIATPYIPRSNEALYTTMGLNGTTEYDTSGYCNNGTRTGTFSWMSDTPKYNVATYFDGSTSYIQLSDSLDQVYNNIFTISMWINPTVDKRGILLGSYTASGLYTTNFELYTGHKLRVHWHNGDVDFNTAAIPLNTWTHIAFVKRSSSSMYVYKNGELFYTASTTFADITGDIIPRIGKDYRTSGTDVNYKGGISDFRIYTTALSASDILELYKMGHVN